MEDLCRDFHAPSTRRAHEARLSTVARAVRDWGLEPYPPTADTLLALSASLKKGAYRSAGNYLHSYKVEAERLGHGWDGQLQRLLKDCTRSCARGLGAPARAAPLPLDRLASLPSSRSPWALEGPVGPRNAMVVGS